MTGRGLRTLGRLCAAAAVASVVAVGLPAGAGVSAAPRATPAAGSELPVHLLTLAPLVPTIGGDLAITGTVTNATSTPVTQVEVGLRLSPTPVHNRSEIPVILAGDAGRTGVSVPGSRVAVADTLAPGGTVTFTLSVPTDSLGLPASRAEVAVLGVESIAAVPGDGQGPVQTGLTRVFLPWFPPGSGVKPSPVVWLFPLSTTPSRLSDGVFLDDHLAAEVAPKGRLTRLLDAAALDPSAVSWVVDPALLQSLEDMADGYKYRGPGGALVVGTGGPAAAAFLDRMRTLVRGADVSSSAYADPDVVALHRNGLDLDVALAGTTASTLPSTELHRPVVGGLAWPPGGVVDEGTLEVLRASGTRLVVLSAASMPPSSDLPYTPSGSVDLATGTTPLRAALFDPVISSLVADAGRARGPVTTDPVVRRQEALAQIAMVSLELPSTPRTLVIAPSVRWSPYAGTAGIVATTGQSPWATPEMLSAFALAAPSDVARTRVDYPASARAAELPSSYLARVKQARTSLAALRSVAPDAAGATDSLAETLTRAESAAWRTDLPGGRALIASTMQVIDEQTEKVRVLSRAPVTLPGESGVIPVTVANDLDRPARVGVRLVGTPSARIESQDVAPFTIAPGQKATLEVQARVVGSGPVTVAIQLLTPDGQDFGAPVVTSVQSAAYASAALWVVSGLFGILVVLLGVNFVRRRRPAARTASTTEDDDA